MHILDSVSPRGIVGESVIMLTFIALYITTDPRQLFCFQLILFKLQKSFNFKNTV